MSLTGERVVLPSLHCDMFLLWVDNWGTELHVSNIRTCFCILLCWLRLLGDQERREEPQVSITLVLSWQDRWRTFTHHVGPHTQILSLLHRPPQSGLLSHLHDSENSGQSQVRQENVLEGS